MAPLQPIRKDPSDDRVQPILGMYEVAPADQEYY